MYFFNKIQINFTINLRIAILYTFQHCFDVGIDEYITDILNKLICLGAKKAIITGVIKDGKYGIISFDSEIDSIGFYAHEKIDQTFYGTGDVFSSACVGALVNGNSLERSVEIAGEFVFESIQKTMSDENARLYGVNFEKALPLLARYNR